MSYVMKGKTATVNVINELEIIFPFRFNSVAIRSPVEIGISPLPNKQIGDENVLRCLANTSIVYPFFSPQDKIYLIGNGEVEIIVGNDFQLNPFESAGGGSSSGTTNYNELSNKPKLNGVTIQGDKTFDDYGLTPLTADELSAMWNN